MSNFFVTLDNIIWSNPIIFLILGSAVFYNYFKGSTGSQYRASGEIIIWSE